MAQMKWIKLETDIFDNLKIKHLRRHARGNEMVLLWIMLLSLAGKCSYQGKIYLTEEIPYTEAMLADELQMDADLVREGLKEMERLKMIRCKNGVYYIVGWEEHQNVDKQELIRKQTKKRVEKYRQKKEECNADVTQCNADVTHCNATEEKRTEEKRGEEKRAEEICQPVAELFNARCPSLRKVLELSKSRVEAVTTLLKKYTLAELGALFDRVERSPYLTGKNDRGWLATFDWVIKSENLIKVAEGNYDAAAPKESKYNDFEKKAIISLSVADLEV